MIKTFYRALFVVSAISLALLVVYFRKLLTDRRLLENKYRNESAEDRTSLHFFGTITFHCYEILGFPQNGLAHFVGSPRFHNSEILVPPKMREKSIFYRFDREAQASNRQTVKSFVKIRSRRAREMSRRSLGARKHA